MLNQGWFKLSRQLTYKQALSGKTENAIDSRNTSRTYSFCGHADTDKRKTPFRFKCVVCGYTTHVQANAARTILAAG